MSGITTIKVQKSTKSALEQLKAESESYDTAIKRLITTIKNTNLKSKLIDAYKSIGKKDLEILEEWEQASSEVKDYG